MKDRPIIVIIGAGLGGCVITKALSQSFKIIFLDRDEKDGSKIVDIGFQSSSDFQHAYGKGGSTRYWHNGLIRIPPEVFQSKWPFSRERLNPYYDEAFRILCSSNPSLIKQKVDALSLQIQNIGLSNSLLGEPLFYPSKRINTWDIVDKKSDIKYICGRITKFNCDKRNSNKNIASVNIVTKRGLEKIPGDCFILAAGGLNTPLILNNLIFPTEKKCTKELRPGSIFEDHPMTFVASFESDVKLYKVWNKSSGFGCGSIRLPLVKNIDGINIAFYIKPSYSEFDKNKLFSSLSEIRNNPINLKNYLNLLKNNDDIVEALSLKFGLNFPTKKYLLLMVAGQNADDGGEILIGKNYNEIVRRWCLAENYKKKLDLAVNSIIEDIRPISTNIKLIDWHNTIKSSAHFSATAKMAKNSSEGVCNENGKVFGFDNLFIADGAAIPASGYSNTGLTIGALALRLGKYLNKIYA